MTHTSNAWLSQRERGSEHAMQLLIWLATKAGRNAARIALWPICLYFFIFSINAKRASRKYLTKVLGKPARWWHVFKHYHSFANTLLDRIYILSAGADYFDVTTNGVEALEAALKHGRGCILLGSHLGSFEMLYAQGRKRSNVRVNMLMYEENAKKINAALNRLSDEYQPQIIPLGKPNTLLQVKEALDRGEIVGILGDRVLGSDRALACLFLDEYAYFPEAPVLLSTLLGAPIVTFVALYRGNKHYDLYFELLSEHPETDRARRDEQIKALVQAYAAWLERYCLSAPYNWFNFYDFWYKKNA